MSFTFDKYVSSLKDCFDTLQEDECPITERNKINYLLDGIRCTQLSSAISNISMNPNLRMTFEEAANTLQREVHRVFLFASQRASAVYRKSAHPMKKTIKTQDQCVRPEETTQ